MCFLEQTEIEVRYNRWFTFFDFSNIGCNKLSTVINTSTCSTTYLYLSETITRLQ